MQAILTTRLIFH